MQDQRQKRAGEREAGSAGAAGAALPSLFISHGAPDLLISRHPARDFLAGLAATLPRPAGIVVVSAHWQTRGLAVSRPGRLATIHDFHGFPAALYEIDYPATATPELVGRLEQALAGAPLGPLQRAERGLDHGAWAPLALIYPRADIPVVQLSLPRAAPADLYDLGRRLAPLRAAGILIIGSGGVVHNLMELARDGTPAPDWAVAFDDWVGERLAAGDRAKLFDFQRQAPQAFRAHPTDEHLLPLFIAWGAGGERPEVRRLYSGFAYGSVALTCYAF
jgi:4,5-DOPA dioxygenase extradiol